MRIDELRLTAFGRFSSQRLALNPGLNLIYGENESGKTTIQKFMLGMLYGFKKRSLRREYTEDALRYRPWQSDEYRGALIYTLDSTGRTYRVEREFDPARESVQLFDERTGADLTDTFGMDRRKELLFAEEQLHIDQEAFTSTAWVGQMQVDRLELGRELVQRVANLQESGREDLSVKAALNVIDGRMREIGTDRAPTRPYARVGRQLLERQAELERAQRTHEQTLEWELGLKEARESLAEIDQALAKTQHQLDWALFREAEERFRRIEASVTKMEAARQRARELSPFAFFPADRRGALQQAQAQQESAAAQVERLERRLADLTAARESLVQGLGPIARALAVDGEVAAEVAASARQAEAGTTRLPGLQEESRRLADMIGNIEEAMAPLTGVPELGEETLAQVERLERELGSLRERVNTAALEELRTEIARLERQRGRVGGWGWLPLAGIGLAAALAVWQVGGPVPEVYRLPAAGGLAFLALLALVAFFGTRRRAGRLLADLRDLRRQHKVEEAAQQEEEGQLKAVERERDQLLRRAGVVSVGELRSQLVRYEQLAARRDGQMLRREAVQAEIRRAEEEVAAHRSRLMELLGESQPEAADTVGGDLLARFREEFAAAQAQRAELDTLQREIMVLEERLDAERERLDSAQAEVAAILAEAGTADLAAFEEACARHEEWRKAEREAEGLRSALQGVLGGQEAAPLAAEVERLRQRVSGEAPASLAPSVTLQAERRRLEGDRAEWQARASDLAARIETALAEVADTADLAQTIAALGDERQAMEEELAALDLARSVLGEVASEMHREFAPRLNEAMGEVVAQLTGGRYQSVRVDEEMTIRALVEGDRLVDLKSLSGGTIDQFYLALRMAMLDLLTEGQERVPLLLDDPFVQYDQPRLEAAMAFLAQVSRRRQVVLMTCHRREAEVGRALGAQVIDLTAQMG